MSDQGKRPWYHWVGMGCGVIMAINLVTCAGFAGCLALGNKRFQDKAQTYEAPEP